MAVEKNFVKYNIKPLLKENGETYIAVSRFKDDYKQMPQELIHNVSEKYFEIFESINYWKICLKKM